MAQEGLAAQATTPAGDPPAQTRGHRPGPGLAGPGKVTNRSRDRAAQQAQSSGRLPLTVVRFRVRVFTLRMPPP